MVGLWSKVVTTVVIFRELYSMKIKSVFLLLFALLLISCSQDSPIVEEQEELITPAEPDYFNGYSNDQVKFIDAQGFPPLTERWELVEVLTDEFEGDAINAEKWNDLHPRWSGRAPSQFKRENTTVADGYLQLKSTSRVSDLSGVADPQKDIWVDAASMTSKAASAQHGYYYEASMKASDLSMTSSFWFRMGEFSEIDVIEHIGHSSIPAKAEDKAHEYHANTFYYGKHEGLDNLANEVQMDTRGRDEFHTFGLWWKDPKTLLFYHNGVEVMIITPRVDFDENLFLIFDTEVFTWDGLPTIPSLNDDTRNTMLVDFVRTYKVTDAKHDSGLLKNGSFEQLGVEHWHWKGDVYLNGLTTNLLQGVINLNLQNGASIIQKIEVSPNTDYQLDWHSRLESGGMNVEIIDIDELSVTDQDWTAKSLTFNSGEDSEIYVRMTASSSANAFLDQISLTAQ